MTIERVVYGVAAWFADNLPDYLVKANEAMAGWPNGTILPALLEAPSATGEAPALVKVGVGNSIPSSGPFPYLLVALDSTDLESAGQCSDWVTLHLKLVVAFQENNEARILPDAARYMDALARAVGEHSTLDGLADEAHLTNLDKDELPANATGFVIGDLSVKFELICD